MFTSQHSKFAVNTLHAKLNSNNGMTHQGCLQW